VPSFRVTYHTTGGPFSRTIEADSAEKLLAEQYEAVEKLPTLEFTEKDTVFGLRSAQVAAISVQEEKSKSALGTPRAVGFLAR
jgi:hypothetical protein